jgi:glucose/arabinose dehydrogenase
MKLMMRCILSVAALAALALPVQAQVKVKLQMVADKLIHPLAMIWSPDGTNRRFIVEQSGTIRIQGADGKIMAKPFLDVSKKIVKLDFEFDERGLLSLAFHPKFKENGKFYVVYSAPIRSTAGRRPRLYFNNTWTLSEFRVAKGNANQADPASERVVLQIDKPQFNHNGGQLVFGPDNYLYISVGDGGWANDNNPIGHTLPSGNGQDLNVHLGKILRIDVDSGTPYAVPKDNPFVGKENVKPEIWAYGLRNPWRLSFDMGGSHQLFAGEVGQNSFEEVDIIVKGANYGWNRMEGLHCFNPNDPNNHPADCDKSGLTMPIVEYPNLNTQKNGKGISVTGGYVYRGKAFANLQGAYVFGDWSKVFAEAEGALFVAMPPQQAGGAWKLQDIEVVGMNPLKQYVLAFGQDPQGEVYVMLTAQTAPGKPEDKIYRIVPAN